MERERATPELDQSSPPDAETLNRERLLPYETLAALRLRLRLKHALDRLGAALLVVLASPLLLAIAAIVYFDGLLHPQSRGPVFYTEPRISGGRPFRIIKFRTAPMACVGWIREKPDERSIAGCTETTLAGGLLLRWYLDELPQLLNVLRGEMSLVGPRPHIASLDRREVELGFRIKHAVRGGLVGMSQSYKRHPQYRHLFERMKDQQAQRAVLELDALYVTRCLEKSALRILFMDASIVARCLLVVICGKG